MRLARYSEYLLIFFSAQTHNGQLAGCGEIFAVFDKKCIGLELQTTPLSINCIYKMSGNGEKGPSRKGDVLRLLVV